MGEQEDVDVEDEGTRVSDRAVLMLRLVLILTPFLHQVVPFASPRPLAPSRPPPLSFSPRFTTRRNSDRPVRISDRPVQGPNDSD